MLQHTILASLVLSLTACGGSTPPTPEPASDVLTPPAQTCIRGGCSGTICQASDAEGMVTTCEWMDSYACYNEATCERQSDGQCGFTPTEALTACLADPPASE